MKHIQTYVVGIIALVLFSSASTAYGVASPFTVRTLIGDDTTPPSVPTGLVATPVATTQINLSWATSTDDLLLSGYQVFRDDVQIATTTVAAYVDTGLSVATLYSYYVTAFDSFNNISASSTVVSTTTRATATPPVTPSAPSDGPTYGSIVRLPELLSLQVIPGQYGVVIRYETKGYVRSIVRWGTTTSYELGSSAEGSFIKNHEIRITELQPGTRYTFTIEGENNVGRFGVLTKSSFTTLPEDDVTPPENVMDVEARQEGNDVVLTWKNPRDTDFDHVRVVRSYNFYPGDMADGWAVFDGGAEATRDTDAFVSHPRAFYTIFAYDKNGNISSGAVVSLVKKGEEVEPIPGEEETSNDINISFDDVVFLQNGERVSPGKEDTLTINGGQHLTLYIPYERVPEHLKTIVVALTPTSDTSKVLRFLLRVNADKTGYSARLAPLGVEGVFTIRVSVFDYKTTQIGYTDGVITSIISNYDDGAGTQGGQGGLNGTSRVFQRDYILLFLLCLIILAYIAYRLIRK